MSEWPLWEGQRHATVANAGTTGVSVAVPATINTKGSWVELDASTDFAADAFMVTILQTWINDYLVDIGIGAAGSEVPLIENIHLGQTRMCIFPFLIPIALPAGTRISARGQQRVDSTTDEVFIVASLFASGFESIAPLSRCETYGISTADSGGQAVTSGLSDAEGSWTEFVASTTFPIRALTFIPGMQADYTRDGSSRWQFDVGIGAAGSEVPILSNLHFGCEGTAFTEDILTPYYYGPLPVSIPSGSRISVRGSFNSLGTNQELDVTLYCFG